MDYQSFQPGAKDQPASPSSVPEISKSQSVSERLRPYQWHIAIVGGIIIVLLFGAYRYLRYTAQQNDAAVAREAQDAQNKIDEIYQKRANLETYHNEQYGFSIALPDSWKGYVVLNSQWEGRDVATGNVTERGPVITLRHPQWTLSAPREDMPVMVFNPAQWQLVQHEEMAVSAAPIPPSILGQNSKYIIALPARYNYDYKTGWEEVDQLVHTLKAFEPGQVSVNGTLSGHVTIGPNCPVERVGVPCTPAPEAYTSR